MKLFECVATTKGALVLMSAIDDMFSVVIVMREDPAELEQAIDLRLKFFLLL